MQVQTVKRDQGWFIKGLLGFEEIKSDVINNGFTSKVS